MMHFWQRFLEVVNKHPEAVAIEEGGSCTTYAQLAAHAAGIGENLIKQGATFETPVAIEMEKSAGYIAALLGCWYAGAAFVPLPPSLPQERRDFILRQADIRHCVTDYDAQVPFTGEFTPVAVREDTLAYIIYTSGSTGEPKGVMVEHRGILNFIDAQIKGFDVARGDKYLFYLSILFDAAISDIGVALLSGAALVIEPADVLRDGVKLVKCLYTRGITHMDVPPSLLKTLDTAQMPDSLKTIIIGGEVCPVDVVRTWAEKFRLVNVYGPTEATVCTSLCVCDPAVWRKPLIGDPMSGVSYAVFDESMNEMEEGELYIGGICLARGYLKQKELTDRKFITHDGKRFYKTGDKVRKSGSDIEFLGRIDRQFKLRGQLVEPDEIETRLTAHAFVKRAAVIKREERLVAFIVADNGITSGMLAAYLEKSLPEWMVPQHFEFLESLPQTATGKADYKALQSVSLKRGSSAIRIMPATDVEQSLWNIWRDIIKHNDFGVTDDFFSIGGDSLGIIRMTLEAERRGLSFDMAAIAKSRTIRKLAASVDAGVDVLTSTFLKNDVAFDGEWESFFTAAKQRPQEENGSPKNIFLTGAAGCLGARLLCELLDKTDAEIYCLVRADNSVSAFTRIKKAVGKFPDAPDDAKLHRVRPLCGDLAFKYFGLDEKTWESLSEKIDTIYHCAAKVNMLLPYGDLRSANVEATQEILRFACGGKRKHIHYASTLSVFVATDQNSGRLLESDRLEKTQNVYGGYAQSKWAAEWMLLQVPQESCAITYYRLGLITGDTTTGGGSDTDFLAMFAKGISSLRAVPEGFDDKLYVDITPVDYAARAITHLSLHGRHAVYHIANGKSLSLGRVIDAIRAQGIDIKPLPPERWLDVVKNISVTTEQTAAGLSLCRCLPQEFEKHRTMDLFQATGVVFDTTNTQEDLKGSGIYHPEVTDDLLGVYMKHFFKDRKTVIKVCIFGPESTGKSTLAKNLAAHFKTTCAEEFAKELIFAQNGNITLADIPRIAQGQIRNAANAEGLANGISFFDTDLITTTIWSDWLFKECPQWIRDAADIEDFDLYLLMDIDTPWVADLHRYLPDERASFLERCKAELAKRDIKYKALSGTWEEKFEKACQLVNKTLTKYDYNQCRKAG